MLGSVVLGIIALFIPPFPVAVRRGCGADLLVNIALTFLCWIPGVAHAFYIIVRYSGKERRRVERQRERRYSGTSKGSSHARSRSRSSPRPRSRSYERRGHMYPRGGYVEPPPPKMGRYGDAGYVYPPAPQPPPQPPVYAYSR